QRASVQIGQRILLVQIGMLRLDLAEQLIQLCRGERRKQRRPLLDRRHSAHRRRRLHLASRGTEHASPLNPLAEQKRSENSKSQDERRNRGEEKTSFGD